MYLIFASFSLDNNKLKLFNDNNHDTLLTPIYIFTIIFVSHWGFYTDILVTPSIIHNLWGMIV